MQVYQSPQEVIAYDLDGPWLIAGQPYLPRLLVRIYPTVISGCDPRHLAGVTAPLQYAIVLGGGRGRDPYSN